MTSQENLTSPDESTRVDDDEDELQALVSSPMADIGCAVQGCKMDRVDERGAIRMVNAKGVAESYWVCEDHWENIITVLGYQALAEEEFDPERDDFDELTLEERLADLKRRDEESKYLEVDDFGDPEDEDEIRTSGIKTRPWSEIRGRVYDQEVEYVDDENRWGEHD